MAMSHLPRDLLKEILSRVPVKSIGAVQSTFKNWNTISNDQSFTEKLFGKAITTKEKEFLVVMKMGFKVYLMSVNLDDNNDVGSFIKRKAKLISLNYDRVLDDIYTVFHCDGLLLLSCVTMLVVLNPYCGQTRCIKPTQGSCQMGDKYALGYAKNKKNNSLHSHKILMFNDDFFYKPYEFEIYNFSSDSWKALYLSLDWKIELYLGVSLKGDTYWFAREVFPSYLEGPIVLYPYGFLICFDFTKERFGPRLRLPFQSCYEDTVILSSVRQEQLVVLFYEQHKSRMEIWVTTKIESDKVSWNKLFLEVNMGHCFQFNHNTTSFFIDEKKNVVVVVVLGKDLCHSKRNVAYIIGKDGYFKKVYLGKPIDKDCDYPRVCSYVPSSVQIKRLGGQGRLS